MDKSPVYSPLFAVVLLIFSIAVGVGAALIAAAVTMRGDPMRASAVAGSVTGTVTLIVLTIWWSNLVRETLGLVSDYQPPERLRLEVKFIDTGQLQYRELAYVDSYTLQEIALHVQRGGNITYRSCAKLFGGEAQFAAFQDSMVAAHYAEWRSPTSRQQGIGLTDAGREMFAALLTQIDDTPEFAAVERATHTTHTPAGEGWIPITRRK